MMVLAMLFTIPAGVASASIPGKMNRCAAFVPDKVTVHSFHSTGRVNRINIDSIYRGAKFTVTTRAYDNVGRYMWVLDRRTFTRDGFKTYRLRTPTRKAWTITATVYGNIPRSPDASCTAKDRVG